MRRWLQRYSNLCPHCRGDIKHRYGADSTIVTFDPKFPCGPEGGQTVGYVAFRRDLYDLIHNRTLDEVKQHQRRTIDLRQG